MVQITLSGGVYDGKVIKVSEEMFNIGCLEIFAPLPEDIDLMAGCHDLKTIKYAKSIEDGYVWKEQHE